MRAGPVVTVGVGLTLAVNWLIPRLTSFYRSHPNVEVRMATGGATRPVRDDWTCTICRDTGAWPGYIAETSVSELSLAGLHSGARIGTATSLRSTKSHANLRHPHAQ